MANKHKRTVRRGNVPEVFINVDKDNKVCLSSLKIKKKEKPHMKIMLHVKNSQKV